MWRVCFRCEFVATAVVAFGRPVPYCGTNCT
eukprot:COSAG01_NODE_41142_length_455_cov_1.016854_1_plen_30_part_01